MWTEVLHLKEGGISMNNTYHILIIDDDYSNTTKKGMFESFLSKEYSEINISFSIDVIEYSRDVRKKISKESIRNIDAFFIDARLEDNSKGWGDPGYGISFNSVLSTIEAACEGIEIPPIFMFSRFWTDEALLTQVSKSFSVFHSYVKPSRFYSKQEIDDYNKSATSLNADGIVDYTLLHDERKYIYDEINKIKHRMFISGVPVDVVLILAVPDEKEMAYKVFGAKDENVKYDPTYNFFYNMVTIRNYNMAIVTLPDMGMVNASIFTTISILAFKPRLVVMTGICAGKKGDVNLSDIVIPTSVFDYSRAKVNPDGNKYRPDHQSLSSAINGYIQNTVNKTLLNSLRTGFVFGDYPNKDINLVRDPMATGTWVVNDAKVFDDISDKIRSDCKSLDMEAYAVALSSKTLETDWLIIKSVQDYANGSKSEDEIQTRKFSAYSSAKLLEEILLGLLDTLERK